MAGCFSDCDDCDEAKTCEIRAKKEHLDEMLRAEFGPDFGLYLTGLSHAIIAAVVHGCKDPGWFGMGVEVGMVTALKDPEFADKLIRICGYGAQVVSNAPSRTTEVIEGLVGALTEPKARAEFGWPQKTED